MKSIKNSGNLPVVHESSISDQKKLPPMMQRYLEIKESYRDGIIFFQVGDFYELFFDDAVTVARSLNLTLTSRDKSDPNPIPMCGVPLSVIDSYVDRLVALGFSCVIVSQDGPAVAGKVVERAVERVVTPGIRLFTSISTDNSEQRVAAITLNADGVGAVASLTVESGEVVVIDVNHVEQIVEALSTTPAKEIVLSQGLDRRHPWVRLLEKFGVSLKFRSTESASGFDPKEVIGFSALSYQGKRAVRLLTVYLDEISVGRGIPIRSFATTQRELGLSIDAATRLNLELVANAHDGSLNGTLLEYLDSTKTPLGRRLLSAWVGTPLASKTAIEERLTIVGAFIQHLTARDKIRELLARVSDTERIALRSELGVVSAKELAALRDSWAVLPEIARAISELSTIGSLSALKERISQPSELYELLAQTLEDSPAQVLGEGPIIREGVDQELDRIRLIKREGDSWFRNYEEEQRKLLGISTLKVKNNGMIGYFLEVPNSQHSKIPANYTRRQSTANAERYTTDELKERERALVESISGELLIEKKLFQELRTKILVHLSEVREFSKLLAELDLFASLAVVAERDNLVCPKILTEPTLDLKAARHPVLARKKGGAFVPNDLSFDHKTRLFVVTGPNMGGKSTYLRQAALIIVMAQIGSFVPADKASIGLVDRVYARIGASDDIHEGDSTFMVEMREAAYILRTATKHSLVLIDEIGRGTATRDGLALAQAILEHLVMRTKARTLFATHFHELTALHSKLEGLDNLSVGALEHEGGVIFSHRIVPGPASCSYGIEVAKLAGIDAEIIERARELMQVAPQQHKIEQNNIQQLPLFMRAPVARPPRWVEELTGKIANTDPDQLTPREALDVLYSLRGIVPKEVKNG